MTRTREKLVLEASSPSIYPFLVSWLIWWSSRLFLIGFLCMKAIFQLMGRSCPSVHSPSTPSSPASLHLVKPILFGQGEDYQSESVSERNNGSVIFRASCFGSKHCRHKQWSSQWLQRSSGSNKSVLYFLFVLVGEGRRRLVVEEHILCFWIFFVFREKLLVEIKMVWWLFSLCQWL